MRYIDLHVHSTYSDGSFTPTKLLKLALQANLAAFALAGRQENRSHTGR